MLRAQWPQAEHRYVVAEARLTFGSAFRTLARHAGPVDLPSRAFAVLADSRIDNREDFSGSLRLGKAELHKLTDAHFIALCIDRWGGNVIAQFAGDFALVVWDRRRDCLLLARDFAGQRPLHFHQGNGIVAATTMAKGLHSLDEVPRDVDDTRLLELLAGKPHEGKGTCFRYIERVEPGEILSLRLEGRASQFYWAPPPGEIRLKSHREYSEALLEKIDAAVAAHLRGVSGNVGTHLSAGLDSGAVTTSAALQFPGTVTSYTAVPPRQLPELPDGRFGDEAPLALAVARHYSNIDHCLVPMPECLELEALPGLLRLFERTDLNLPNLAWSTEINAAARRHGVRVMLVGTMGNATLSYAGSEHPGELLAAGRVGRFLATLVKAHRRGTGAAGLLTKAIKRVLPPAIALALSRSRITHGHPAELGIINPEFPGFDALMKWMEDYLTQPRPTSIETRLRMIRRVDQGTYYKGIELGWDIELRDPTVDRRLVEFCLQVPLEQYFYDGAPRALARTALWRRVPIAREVGGLRGLQSPHWFAMLSSAQGEIARLLKDSEGSELVARLLDRQKMHDLVERWPAADDPGPPIYRYGLLRGLVAGQFIRMNSLR